MKDLFTIATGEIGVKEVSGQEANPRIIQYAKDCGFSDYSSDETAWCSLYMNWIAHESGLQRSKSLSARSWLHVGLPVQHPEPGDVVIFWRESRDSWKGHVGLFFGFSVEGSRVYCLGGNQGNQVSITAYSADMVLGYRRLMPVGKIEIPEKILKKGDTGKDVVQLQDALKQLSFNCGTSDGIFGSRTEQSLKEFQTTNRELTVSGVLDTATRNYLIETLKTKNI